MSNFAKNVVNVTSKLITDSNSLSSAEVQQIVITKPNLELKLMKLYIDNNLVNNIEKFAFSSSETTSTIASSSLSSSSNSQMTAVKLTVSALNLIKAYGDEFILKVPTSKQNLYGGSNITSSISSIDVLITNNQ